MSSPTKSPLTPTPRKKHHCTRCGAPMLGHKRGGCQSPTNDASPKSDPRRKSLSPLDFKMKALDIASPEKEERERAQRRRSSAAHAPRPETLVSLSSNDKAALSILAKPGMMSEKFPKTRRQSCKETSRNGWYSVPPPRLRANPDGPRDHPTPNWPQMRSRSSKIP